MKKLMEAWKEEKNNERERQWVAQRAQNCLIQNKMPDQIVKLRSDVRKLKLLKDVDNLADWHNRHIFLFTMLLQLLQY